MKKKFRKGMEKGERKKKKNLSNNLFLAQKGDEGQGGVWKRKCEERKE